MAFILFQSSDLSCQTQIPFYPTCKAFSHANGTKGSLSAAIWRPLMAHVVQPTPLAEWWPDADAIHASVALAADKKRRDYGVFCSELNGVPHLSTHLPVPPTPSVHPCTPLPVTDPPLPILGFCPSVCVCHLRGSEINVATDVTSYSQLIYILAVKRLKSKPNAGSWFCLPSEQILPSFYHTLFMLSVWTAAKTVPHHKITK